MGDTPVTVVGTLVSDMRPRRVGADAALVLNFRVAGNERRFDRASESWVNGESLYLSVNCWRRLAENAASLVKGDPVIVTGKLRTREWTTDQGERRSVTELEANAVGPDLARCTVTVHKRRKDEERISAGQHPAADEESGSVDAEPGAEGAETRDTATSAVASLDTLTQADADAVTLSELAAAARPLVPMSG
jgi:single-strand DNA-binding protein